MTHGDRNEYIIIIIIIIIIIKILVISRALRQ